MLRAEGLQLDWHVQADLLRVLRLELLVLVELKCNGLYFLVRLLVDSGLGEDKGLVLDQQRRLPPRAAVLGALRLG